MSIQAHEKNGAPNLIIHLIPRNSTPTSHQHWANPLRKRLKTTKKRWVKGFKGDGCWESKQGREFSTNLLQITTFDMHCGSCLLIIHYRRLLCHQVPGTICWLLCEKIGKTRANHFPPIIPIWWFRFKLPGWRRGGIKKKEVRQEREATESTLWTLCQHEQLEHFYVTTAII